MTIGWEASFCRAQKRALKPELCVCIVFVAPGLKPGGRGICWLRVWKGAVARRRRQLWMEGGVRSRTWMEDNNMQKFLMTELNVQKECIAQAGGGHSFMPKQRQKPFLKLYTLQTST